MSSAREVDVVIVGAGFAGLYMLQRARRLGLKARAYEAGSGVGGTWYWNRYPGARCDVESLEYSYGFDEALQQEWRWRERYAAQPEILSYANHVADRFNLRADIELDTRVTGATWDEADRRWRVSTGTGAPVAARFLVMATGCLSSANVPQIKGRESFAGRSYHTGQWPHEKVDFRGQRVGVIGTGSSAVQSIPVIAAEAAQLYVFQRTATYSAPAHNGPLDPGYEARIKGDYDGFRARNRRMPAGFGSHMPRDEGSALAVGAKDRARAYESCWQRGGLGFLRAFADLILDQRANDTAAEFVRGKIRATVRDAAAAQLLEPKQTIGCKRMCVDSGYYEAFNRDNVHLVDISGGGIEEITPRGLKAGGREYALDRIVYATGFDAMTGSLLRMEIRGRGGLTLKDKWHAGPRSYLGLGVAGFPNLFIITGPGSPSVLTNMIVSIEQQVDWIAECLAFLRAHGRVLIEADGAAEEQWVAHVNAVAERTVYPSCNSWYLGANVPGKVRVFMPLVGFPPYAEKCTDVAARGYEGFALS